MAATAPAAPTAGGPAPRSSLLRHADFLKLWSAETISQAGTQISLLAIPVVAVLLLNASPFEVALLGTIEMLPFILFTLPAGVWVDRLRRRPILIVGDLVRAASLISLPAAFSLGALSMPQLYLVGFINGIATVFFDVAYQSYLPALVERDQLVDGNSKLEISRSGAAVLGPGAAGILIGAIGAPVAIVADSISFLASAAFLFGIRRREPPVERRIDEHGREHRSMRAETMEGLRYVLGHRYLRAIAACTSVSNLFNQFVFAILVLYLLRQLGLTPEIVGIVFSIGAVGFLVGALAGNRVAARLGVGRTIVLAAVGFGVGNVLIGLAPPDLAVPFIVAGVFIGGLSGVIYNINQVSLRQAITPERMQGRMNATMRFLVWGTIPIGSLLAGALATLIGLRETILLGGLGGFASFLFVFFSPVRSLREMPEPIGARAREHPSALDSPAERLSEALDETGAPLGLGPMGRPDAN